MYLPQSAARAVFQGDIFAEVPFTNPGAGDTEASDPKIETPRAHATPVLFPCDMVANDNVALVKRQPVALVYDAQQKGLPVSDDFDEMTLGVCPLPDLH